MKNILLFLGIFITDFAFAQTYYNPINDNFNVLLNQTCPYNPDIEINAIEGWEIFQTLDGSIESEIDSSICISVSDDASNNIYLDQIDESRPLFFRQKFTYEEGLNLDSNYVYSANLIFYVSDSLPVKLGADCESDLCSGLTYTIASLDGTLERKSIQQLNGGGNPCDVLMCLVTEKMPDQKIVETLLKISFDGILDTTDYIKLSEHHIYTEHTFPINDINNYIYDNSGSYYFYGDWGSNLILHNNDGIPSETNIAYHEILPINPTAEQEEINLYIDMYSGYNIQAFTQYRGTIVDGQDSIRHTINLHLEDGTMCISPIIDKTFKNGDQFTYHSGDIHFSSTNSCMQFGKNSNLNIIDGASFHYGHGGNGILMMRTNSSMKLGYGSELYFDGKLWMLESLEETEPGQIYMELNEGSKLVFSEHAIISNLYSKTGEMKLNIFMNGGELDLSALNPKYRHLIHLIYPNDPIYNNDNFSIYPNPNNGNSLSIDMNSSKINEIGEISILDISGREIFHKNFKLDLGKNKITLPIHSLNNGIYLISIKRDNGMITQKLVRG